MYAVKWAFGLGVPVLIIILFIVFAPVAAAKLGNAIARGFFDGLRWVIEQWRKNAWRVLCIAAAMVCIVLTGQWDNARDTAAAAVEQVETTTTKYVELVRIEKENVETAKAETKAAILKCDTERTAANAKAKARIDELEAQNQAYQKRVDAAMVQIRSTYKKDLQDAKHEGDAVAAGIRDGSIRLPGKSAEGSVATGGGGRSSVPGTTSSTTGIDGGAEVWSGRIGRAIGAAGSCDAQVRALQSVLKAERQAK